MLRAQAIVGLFSPIRCAQARRECSSSGAGRRASAPRALDGVAKTPTYGRCLAPWARGVGSVLMALLRSVTFGPGRPPLILRRARWSSPSSSIRTGNGRVDTRAGRVISVSSRTDELAQRRRAASARPTRFVPDSPSPPGGRATAERSSSLFVPGRRRSGRDIGETAAQVPTPVGSTGRWSPARQDVTFSCCS